MKGPLSFNYFFKLYKLDERIDTTVNKANQHLKIIARGFQTSNCKALFTMKSNICPTHFGTYLSCMIILRANIQKNIDKLKRIEIICNLKQECG